MAFSLSNWNAIILFPGRHLLGVLECHQFQIVDTSESNGGIKPICCVWEILWNSRLKFKLESFLQIKLKFKSEYYWRINSWNHVKMQTTAITLWFPVHSFSENFLLGFFIWEKWLAGQTMFLVKSKLSITMYLFLVFNRSTTVQSPLFRKNIENFLCTQKLVNNHSIPSTRADRKKYQSFW